eukprot:GEMP01088746.1.p2 GENE.GEMP01088746.1~~GEMP01088746.1.p2  ORF type:complete len:103 (+),score=0.62 GEMP01088746.1:444-752(+)
MLAVAGLKILRFICLQLVTEKKKSCVFVRFYIHNAVVCLFTTDHKSPLRIFDFLAVSNCFCCGTFCFVSIRPLREGNMREEAQPVWRASNGVQRDDIIFIAL